MKKQTKIDVVNDKCQNCGGIIKFSPKHQNLYCDTCKTIFPFEKQQKIIKHDISEKHDNEEYNKWVNQSKFVSCTNCGAKLIMGQYEISKTCQYCGSEYVSEIKMLPGLKPDGIIPFMFDKKEAGIKFRNSVKKKFFVPRKFKQQLSESSIHGIYVPVFSFDADVEAKYNGSLVRSESVYINGQHKSVDETFYIHGKTKKSFKSVLVETSSKISNYDLEGITPFKMEEAFSFDSKFIKGYSVEHYQDALDTCSDIAKSIMTDRLRKEILQDYNYTSVNNVDIDSKYKNEKYSYYLLPVYNFECKYGKQTYITQMNGQTGKVGRGLPISGLKVGILIALGLIAITALTICFFNFGKL